MSDGRKTDNLTMRIWLELIQNIVGPNGLKSTLNYSKMGKYIDNFPPDNDELEIPVEDIVKLYSSLVELFGQKGAHVLDIQAGKEFVRVGAQKRPEITKHLEEKTGSLPEAEKIRFSLNVFAEQHEKRWTSQGDVPRYELKEDDDYFLFIDRDNPMSKSRTSETPSCGTIIGMLQYQIEMITGHLHEVKEIECRAMGHPADVFRIAKAPTTC